MPTLTRRRDPDAHQQCWRIYYGDVHVGFRDTFGDAFRALPSNRQATFQRFGRYKSGSDWKRSVKTDLDFLLYPLATEGPPDCPACGRPMEIVGYEARENNPDFSRFRCTACKRSETFVCEE
jgi:hypothetical protein